MSPATAVGKRRRAPRGQGERLREEILGAAERLLVETGDEEAVSIRAVADAVGVTPPSIYLHFADKNALLLAVCEEQFRLFGEYVESRCAHIADPIEQLMARGKAYVQFGIDHPEAYRLMFMTRASQMPRADRSQSRGNRRVSLSVRATEQCAPRR